MAPKAPRHPDQTLRKLAAQLDKLAEASPDRRFTALGDVTTAVTTGIALARQDAILEWVDELTTRQVRPMSRTDAVRLIIEKTKLARTSVFNVLLAAERRYGRPKHAVGRPRRDAQPEPTGAYNRELGRMSHAACEHPATASARAACRKATIRADTTARVLALGEA